MLQCFLGRAGRGKGKDVVEISSRAIENEEIHQMKSAEGGTQKVQYTAKAHTVGGRDGGNSRTDDGR